MDDREALMIEADAYQARMDACADMTVWLSEEKMAISRLQDQLAARYEQLRRVREEVLARLGEQPMQ